VFVIDTEGNKIMWNAQCGIMHPFFNILFPILMRHPQLSSCFSKKNRRSTAKPGGGFYLIIAEAQPILGE